MLQTSAKHALQVFSDLFVLQPQGGSVSAPSSGGGDDEKQQQQQQEKKGRKKEKAKG